MALHLRVEFALAPLLAKNPRDTEEPCAQPSHRGFTPSNAEQPTKPSQSLPKMALTIRSAEPPWDRRVMLGAPGCSKPAARPLRSMPAPRKRANLPEHENRKGSPRIVAAGAMLPACRQRLRSRRVSIHRAGPCAKCFSFPRPTPRECQFPGYAV